MLRRPPTSIELKLDDISEYEEMKQNKEKQQKSFSPPVWSVAPKTNKEIYARIGYVPPEHVQPHTNLM
ncbi:unnamed protein product [Diabrotica balteata]|uniref:Cell division cycle protein 26 homolog n=1 Tax=Diabrotica balteata TaxID=107213 RepID=A0A9N9X756_DIABA|nr:unnamed protein product [Diabrotica balteata]